MAKLKLTPALQAEICEKIAAVATFRDACTLAGVDESTAFKWLRKGQEQKRGVYRRFFQAIELAKSQRRTSIKAQIRVHARRDWRAAAALGAITDPEEFVPQLRVHVTSQLDGALDRLKEAFANDPEGYERALHAIVGGARSVAPEGAPAAEDGADPGGGEAVRAAPAVGDATGIPEP